MASNVEQFSLYAVAILDSLFANFPVPVEITLTDYVERFDALKLMNKLHERVLEIPDDPISFARADQAAENYDKVTEAAKRNEKNRNIFRGTIGFLISEGYVRSADPYPDENLYRGCQLTAKGFSHLNKEFKDKTITDGGSTIIRWIKERFSSASSIEGAVVVGVITKFLG
jgi:hypothetical protein